MSKAVIATDPPAGSAIHMLASSLTLGARLGYFGRPPHPPARLCQAEMQLSSLIQIPENAQKGRSLLSQQMCSVPSAAD